MQAELTKNIFYLILSSPPINSYSFKAFYSKKRQVDYKENSMKLQRPNKDSLANEEIKSSVFALKRNTTQLPRMSPQNDLIELKERKIEKQEMDGLDKEKKNEEKKEKKITKHEEIEPLHNKANYENKNNVSPVRLEIDLNYSNYPPKYKPLIMLLITLVKSAKTINVLI